MTSNKSFLLTIRRLHNETKENNNFITNINEEKQIINVTNKQYHFELDSSYPFACPKKFYCNGISIEADASIATKCERVNYSSIIKMPSERFSLVLKKITGEKCLCCSSLICPGNWNPTVTLQLLIDESQKIIRIKQQIVEKIMADLIKTKYLYSEINLDQYIY